MFLLLDRYLLKQFSGNVLKVLAGFLVLTVLIDFFEFIDDFIKAKKSLLLLGHYFIFKTPFVMEQLLPVCILLGGVLTIGLLNHSGELRTLKAGGINIVRICIPIISGAILFSCISLAMSQWLLPVTVSKSNRILYEEVRGEIPKGIYRNGRYYYRGEHGFYSFTRHDPKAMHYTNFHYTSWDDSYRPRMALSADSAVWQDGGWIFQNGRIHKRTEQVDDTVTFFKRMNLDLPEKPEDFFIPQYKLEEMSLTDLFAEMRASGPQHDPESRLRFHSRLSYIFLGLPLLLLGLPILLLVHQRWGRDLSVAVPMSCGLAFVAWGCWGVALSLSKAGYLYPVLAAWSVHLITGGLGIYLIKQQDK